MNGWIDRLIDLRTDGYIEVMEHCALLLALGGTSMDKERKRQWVFEGTRGPAWTRGIHVPVGPVEVPHVAVPIVVGLWRKPQTKWI